MSLILACEGGGGSSVGPLGPCDSCFVYLHCPVGKNGFDLTDGGAPGNDYVSGPTIAYRHGCFAFEICLNKCGAALQQGEL